MLSYKHTIKYFKKLTKAAIRFVTQPRIKRNELTEHFFRLGLRHGDSVLVHSSLSAAGRIERGSEGVIESLMEVVGSTGALLFPTHNWPEVNRGYRKFDVRNSPSRVGVISETFRCRSDVIRSEHPSHSVAAWGERSSYFVSDHLKCDAPCGFGSPYHKLLIEHGKILLFGVGLERNTFFHCSEALAGCPYLLKADRDRFEITDASGDTQSVAVRCHAKAIPSRFAELQCDLTSAGCLHVDRIGKSRSMVIDAHVFHEWMLPILIANPSFLLKNQSESVFRH